MPSIKELYCENNQLAHLSKLPESLKKMKCDGNSWNPQFKLQVANAERAERGGKLERSGDELVWVYWIQRNEETAMQVYMRAIDGYRKVQANIKKRAQKLIQIHQSMVYGTRLNNDVVNRICSFISGADGTLRNQLGSLKNLCDTGRIV